MEKQPTEKIQPKGKKKGVVVSDSLDKSVIVEVTMLKTLKKYHKKYRDTKRYLVHDESNSHKKGDEVVFRQSKPHSKGKRWEIV